MTTTDPEAPVVALDDEGYLERFDDWSDAVACTLAEREGLEADCPLSEERLAILRFMRVYYRRFDAFPVLRAVCKSVGQDKECVTEQFPDPIVAWRIAGLPKPTTEVFANLRRHG